MSEDWTPGASFGKVFHKGVGEPVLAGLLYHFTSLKFHYPPQDMDKILFPAGELRGRVWKQGKKERDFLKKLQNIQKLKGKCSLANQYVSSSRQLLIEILNKHKMFVCVCACVLFNTRSFASLSFETLGMMGSELME